MKINTMQLRSGKRDIEIKTLTGKKYVISVTPDTTIRYIMSQIELQSNFPVRHQRIFHGGRQYLNNELDMSLQELGNPSHLKLVLRMLCTCCSPVLDPFTGQTL